MEKECEIKRVKDRLDKQKKSQLHTRREQHKRDEKTLMKKIRCILKVKKTERGGGGKLPLFPLVREQREGAAEVQGQSENRGKKRRGKEEKRKSWGEEVSGVGANKPGVPSLQRHVHRLNQVPASQQHFHVTSWTFA